LIPTCSGTRIVDPKTKADPKLFYHSVIRPKLEQHPVLKDAEVLNTGRGLHAIIWFDKAVEFTSDGERQRWAGIVRTIQAVLPTDPDCPGITALTRARGSINTKTGKTVQQLHAGTPVSVESVLELFEQLRTKPFRTVMRILFGSEKVQPCPVCGRDDTTLNALDFIGSCYGTCGRSSWPRCTTSS